MDAPRSTTRSLTTAVIVNAFGAGLFFPFSFLLFQSATSLSAGRIGLVMTLATLVSLLANPVAGRLADRHGARRIVVIGQVIEAIGMVSYLLVTTAPSLFAAVLVTTAGTRVFFASFSTLIAERIEAGGRDAWFGRIAVCQTIGGTVGGVLASLLLDLAGPVGFRVIALANAGCLLVAAVLIALLPAWHAGQAQAIATEDATAMLRDRPYLWLVGINGLHMLCSMLPGLGIVVYVHEALGLPLWQASALGLVNSTLILGLQARVTHRVRFRRRTTVMRVAAWLWVLACGVYVLTWFLPESLALQGLLAAGIPFTISQMLYIPASRALSAAMAPEYARGRYIAMYELSYGLAAALGPFAFGYWYDVWPAAPWLFVGSLSALGAVALMALHRHLDSKVDVPVTTARDR